MKINRSTTIVLLIIGLFAIVTIYLINTNQTEKETPIYKEEGSKQATTAEAMAKKASQREADLQLFLEEPYFRLPIITVPIVRKGRVRGVLHLRLLMQAVVHKNFQLAKILMPYLVDGIYTDLYKAFSNLWIENTEPAPEVIAKRLQKSVDEAVGKGIIDAILLREFFFTHE